MPSLYGLRETKNKRCNSCILITKRVASTNYSDKNMGLQKNAKMITRLSGSIWSKSSNSSAKFLGVVILCNKKIISWSGSKVA